MRSLTSAVLEHACALLRLRDLDAAGAWVRGEGPVHVVILLATVLAGLAAVRLLQCPRNVPWYEAFLESRA